jgi:hypothetical protein
LVIPIHIVQPGGGAILAGYNPVDLLKYIMVAWKSGVA